MTLRQFLEYKLLEIDKYSISVYNVLFIILLFAFIQLLLWGITILINKTPLKQKLDKGQRFTLRKLIQYFLYTLGVVLALENIGVNITILLAGSAALLVGVGLGIQHIFNDIVSGFVILFEGVIQVGDIIEVNGTMARVEKIAIRTSRVMTRDGNVIIMPNSVITSNNVINWSQNIDETRFTITVGVAYGSDTSLVKRVLEDCAEGHPAVIDGRSVVLFRDFADSALLFDLIFWSHEKWLIEIVKSELRFSIDKAFREHHIRIPFPQRDLHIIDQTRQG